MNAAVREALRAVDMFVRNWGLPMPEDIHAAFMRPPPVPEGLYLRLMAIKKSVRPPLVGEKFDRETVENLYFYFAVHEYPTLRAKILLQQEIASIAKEFPALYSLLRVIERLTGQVTVLEKEGNEP